MSAPFIKTKGEQEEAPSMDSDELQLVKKINHLATLRWPYLGWLRVSLLLPFFVHVQPVRLGWWCASRMQWRGLRPYR
jgi:hypothetical protein